MTDPTRPFATKSDAELAALEQDRTLPLDQWTEVERERGLRNKEAGTAPPGTNRPEARPTADGSIGQALRDLDGLLVPGERLLAYAVQRRLFALTHRREVVAATTGRFIAVSLPPH